MTEQTNLKVINWVLNGYRYLNAHSSEADNYRGRMLENIKVNLKVENEFSNLGRLKGKSQCFLRITLDSALLCQLNLSKELFCELVYLL